ncbi:3169_t:CDS:1, partial [Racocetra fulgida]
NFSGSAISEFAKVVNSSKKFRWFNSSNNSNVVIHPLDKFILKFSIYELSVIDCSFEEFQEKNTFKNA